MQTTWKEYLTITLGTLLVSFNIHFFLSPNHFAPGGISGLSIVLKEYFPGIPLGLLMMLINLILVAVGFLVIGKNCGWKTIYAGYLLAFFVWLEDKLFPLDTPLSHDLMVQLIVGIIIGAIGDAIVFNQEASTGGIDIIAMIINKFLPIELGQAVLFSNLFIVLMSVVTFGPQAGMYAFLGVILRGLVIDYLLHAFNENKEVMIISIKTEEIRRYIVQDLGKGATIHTAKGGFSKDEKEVITTILSKRDVMKLIKYISKADCHAFVTVHDMNEIMGDRYKSFA